MSWACELTQDAEKDLRDLPGNARRSIARILDQMAANPFLGDTKVLKGSEWKGVFDVALARIASFSRRIISLKL
jgi:hypothetical protein